MEIGVPQKQGLRIPGFRKMFPVTLTYEAMAFTMSSVSRGAVMSNSGKKSWKNLLRCSVFIVSIANDNVRAFATKPRFDALETTIFAW